jgi:hypothetical protein
MINRHEYISAPSCAHDPQRDRVSRKLIRVTGRPTIVAYRSDAADSRSRAISLRNAPARTPACAGSPGTNSESPSILGARPVAGVRVNNRPSTGRIVPIPTPACDGMRDRVVLIQSSCARAKAIASDSCARRGTDSVTRPSSRDTRNENRRARADRRSVISTGGVPESTGMASP